MARGYILTAAEKNNLVTDFYKGMTKVELVKRYDVCVKTVGKIIKEYESIGKFVDMERAKPVKTSDNKEYMTDIYPELARDWDCTRLKILKAIGCR